MKTYEKEFEILDCDCMVGKWSMRKPYERHSRDWAYNLFLVERLIENVGVEKVLFGSDAVLFSNAPN